MGAIAIPVASADRGDERKSCTLIEESKMRERE